jgi:hypothetical protein
MKIRNKRGPKLNPCGTPEKRIHGCGIIIQLFTIPRERIEEFKQIMIDKCIIHSFLF